MVLLSAASKGSTAPLPRVVTRCPWCCQENIFGAVASNIEVKYTNKIPAAIGGRLYLVPIQILLIMLEQIRMS